MRSRASHALYQAVRSELYAEIDSFASFHVQACNTAKRGFAPLRRSLIVQQPLASDRAWRHASERLGRSCSRFMSISLDVSVGRFDANERLGRFAAACPALDWTPASGVLLQRVS